MCVEDKKSYDLTVSGPTTLFWLSEGTLGECGTEVTLWLKPQFGLHHKHSLFIPSLRRLLYGILSANVYDTGLKSNGKYLIDPGMVACSTAMWPLYPILIRPPLDMKTGEFTWRVDDRFHLDHVLALDTARVKNMAKRWRVPARSVEKLEWSPADWVDPVSGSRIRVLGVMAGGAAGDSTWGFLQPVPSPGPLTSLQTGILIELQLPDSNAQVSRRRRILVNGMVVENLHIVEREVKIAHNIGTLCWVDLRGDAAPVLTANRAAAKESQSPDWEREMNQMMERYRRAIASVFHDRPLWCRQDIACSIGGVGVPTNYESGLVVVNVVKHLEHHFQPVWNTPNRLELSTQLYWLEQAAQNRLGRDQALLTALDDAESNAREEDLDLAKKIAKARATAGQRDFWSSRANRDDVFEHVELALAIAHSGSHSVHRDISFDLGNAVWGQPTFTVNDSQTEQILDAWELLVTTHLFAELFEPDLCRAHGLVRMEGLEGRLGHGVLLGPLVVELGIHAKTVFTGRDPNGIETAQTIRGYDLVCPLTNVPCGELRRNCSEWSTDRWLRLAMLAPFLVPRSPSRWLSGTTAIIETIGVESLLLLIPNADLWERQFSDWTEDDWKNQVTSALWDIKKQKVFWACGVTSRKDILRDGKTLCQLTKLDDD